MFVKNVRNFMNVKIQIVRIWDYIKKMNLDTYESFVHLEIDKDHYELRGIYVNNIVSYKDMKDLTQRMKNPSNDLGGDRLQWKIKI